MSRWVLVFLLCTGFFRSAVPYPKHSSQGEFPGSEERLAFDDARPRKTMEEMALQGDVKLNVGINNMIKRSVVEEDRPKKETNKVVERQPGPGGIGPGGTGPGGIGGALDNGPQPIGGAIHDGNLVVSLLPLGLLVAIFFLTLL